MGLPVGLQRLRSAASLAPYSPLVAAPQTPPRCKRTTVRFAAKLRGTFHLLPHRRAAVDSVGIKLHPHGLRVEVFEIDLDLKYMLVTFGLHF